MFNQEMEVNSISKVTKTISLDVDQIRAVDELINAGLYETFSAFIQEAIQDKMNG